MTDDDGWLRARVADLEGRLSRLQSAHDLTSGLLTGAGERIAALEDLRAALIKGRAEVDESADHRAWRDMIDRVLAGARSTPAPADPAFYLHRLDMCRCGKRRGDHEGAQPQPCPETRCEAFTLAEAHDPRAKPLEVPHRIAAAQPAAMRPMAARQAAIQMARVNAGAATISPGELIADLKPEAARAAARAARRSLHDLLTPTDPDVIGWSAGELLYAEPEIRAKATHVVPLLPEPLENAAPRGLLAVLETPGSAHVSFIVVEWVTGPGVSVATGAVEVPALYQPIFHGEGPSGTLRELRHTHWGHADDGYLHEPNGALIAAAFEALKRWFDCWRRT